jgi:hypothetical protein
MKDKIIEYGAFIFGIVAAWGINTLLVEWFK